MLTYEPGETPYRRPPNQYAQPGGGGGGGGAPGAPGGSQIPMAGIYAQRQAQAEQAYQMALAQIQQKRQGVLRNFGFLENGQVDPNNQYGKIQTMNRGQAISANQAEEGQRQRGFANLEGLAGRQTGRLAFDQGGERQGMQQSYDDTLQELANAQLQADFTKNQSLLDIQQQAVQDAIEQERYRQAQAPNEPAPAALPSRATVRRTVRAVAKRTKKKGKR